MSDTPKTFEEACAVTRVKAEDQYIGVYRVFYGAGRAALLAELLSGVEVGEKEKYDEAMKGWKSANRRGLESEEHEAEALAALNELIAYLSLPSDLPPMEVVKRIVEVFQALQAQKDANCNTCDGQGFVASEDDPEDGWTCEDCEGSGSELRATVRKLEAERKNYEGRIFKLEQYLAGSREEVLALKADIQNRDVNAREAVERYERTVARLQRERNEAIRELDRLRSEVWGAEHLDDVADRMLERIGYQPLDVEDERTWSEVRNSLGLPFAEDAGRAQAAERQLAQQAGEVPDVDALANFIRSIDGRHTMGAGEMAERIVEWVEGRRG